LEKVVKELLSEKRYEHSMGVARTAKCIAKNLGMDEEKAYLAGVVHDIAKEKPVSEMIRLCDEGKVHADEIELKNVALLHAPAGAAMLEKFGITDSDIKNAVRYHTVGRAGMSQLEKIIYLSDMIEPSRSYPEVYELRELCEVDFEKSFETALKYSIEWNLKKGSLIHEGTLRAWNDALGRRNVK